MSVTSGDNGVISITLNSSYGIDAGSAVRIRLGTYALFGEAGNSDIVNPTATGTYRIDFEIYDQSDVLIGDRYVLIALVEPVKMSGKIIKMRFNGSPSGLIAAGTTQTIISLETNYDATCRFSYASSTIYNNASNTPYDLMTNQFSYTGQRFHSILFTGLISGEIYYFYVRCFDDFLLVPDTTDYLISFEVKAEGAGESEGTGEGDQGGSGTGGGHGGGGAGGGSGGGFGHDEGPGVGDYLPYPPPPGSPGVVLLGWGYPMRDVHIIKDGVEIGKASANAGAEFAAFYSIPTQGTYSFGVWSDDSSARKSITISSTFFIAAGTQTTVSDIILPPTIAINKTVFDTAETFHLYGQTVPSTTVEVWLYPDKAGQPENSDIIKLIKPSSIIGQWELYYNTKDLTEKTYQVKARVQLSDLLVSDFGQILKFSIGQPLPEQQTCAGADLNGDGRVNITDFSILLYWWGSNNSCSDQNSDGKVDLIDFSIMMFNWTG